MNARGRSTQARRIAGAVAMLALCALDLRCLLTAPDRRDLEGKDPDAGAPDAGPDAPDEDADDSTETIWQGDGVPRGIALDGSYVYWTVDCVGLQCESGVKRRAKAGGGVVDFVSASAGSPIGIAVAPAEVVYYTLQGDSSGVVRATRGQNETVETSLMSPSEIRTVGERVFWNFEKRPILHRAPPDVDGGVVELDLGGTEIAEDIAGSPDGAFVYVTSIPKGGDPAAGKIWRLTADATSCGPPTTLCTILIEDQANAKGIAADGKRIYWSSTKNGSPEIWSAAADGAGAASLVDATDTTHDIAVDATRIYWSTGGGIYTARKDAPAAILYVPTETDCKGARIALDDGFVYWTCPQAKTVQRAPKPDKSSP